MFCSWAGSSARGSSRATSGGATGAGGSATGRDCVTMGAAWRGCGTIMRGFGGSAAGASVRAAGGGVVGRAAGGAVTGREAAGGAVGRGGAGGGAACGFFARSRIARISPGLETCEKSNFGFRSSPSRGAPRCPSPRLPCVFWMKARTRSASSTSMELECVFFSVTPTWGSTSRIALLFTSSSLARSLIRIFCCIRLFLFPPNMPSDAHVTSSRIRCLGSSFVISCCRTATSLSAILVVSLHRLPGASTAFPAEYHPRRDACRARPPQPRRPAERLPRSSG
jgi:hypothetical protein